MTRTGKIIDRIFGFLDRSIKFVLKWLTIVLFIALSFILTANVFVRFVPVISLHWFDEVVEMLYASLVFYGSAIVWIGKAHFSIGDWISKFAKTNRLKAIYRLFTATACFAFIFIFFIYALEITLKSHEFTPVIGMPKAVLYSCMPISAFIMTVYSIIDVFKGVFDVIKK